MVSRPVAWLKGDVTRMWAVCPTWYFSLSATSFTCCSPPNIQGIYPGSLLAAQNCMVVRTVLPLASLLSAIRPYSPPVGGVNRYVARPLPSVMTDACEIGTSFNFHGSLLPCAGAI